MNKLRTLRPVAPLLVLALTPLACMAPVEGVDEAGSGEPIGETTEALSSTRTLHQGGGSEREASGRYGDTLALGDFNDDGYQDIVVGAPYNDTSDGNDSGWVEIYWGGSSGPGSHGREHFTQNSIAGASRAAGDRLGYAFAVGDFDRDGFDDLAVSMPYKDVGGKSQAGLVAVMYGSSSGLIPANSQLLEQGDSIHASTEAGDRFGYAMTAGDFDDDGFDDLAIGAPYEDVGGDSDVGSVTIFYGGQSGLENTENVTENSVSDLERAAGDRFGYRLESGDFDNDGFDDLVVSAPYYDYWDRSNAGAVAVMHGSSAGVLPARTRTLRATSPSESEYFGLALAVGDLDDDGFDDLAIAAPLSDWNDLTNNGEVGIIFGSSSALRSSPHKRLTKASIGVDRAAGDRFGHSLAIADFDDDSFDDLAIGIPYHDDPEATNAGAIGLVFGDSARDLTKVDIGDQRTMFNYANENNDYLGRVLAAGDVDRDGQAELIAGVPLEDWGTTTNSGVVYVQTPTPVLPELDVAGAVVLDRSSGKVLAGFNAHERLATGSTAKIMTALLTLEAIERNELSLNDIVTVSTNAANNVGSCMEPLGGGLVCQNDPTAGLRPGDRISVRDLLYGLMLPSGNEAAVALAEKLAGSEGGLLPLMNTRAASLGMSRTHFATVHGRDPEDTVSGCGGKGTVLDDSECSHYSTPRDMAILARAALTKSLFRTIVSSESHTTTTWQRLTFRGSVLPPIYASVDGTLCTTNQFLRDGSVCSSSSNSNMSNFSTASVSVYGVKTGTTDQAGSCLVSAATDGSGNDVISVVFNAADRYGASRTALDFAFSL